MVILVDIPAEGRRVVMSVRGVGGLGVHHDEMWRTALQRLDDSCYLLRSSEIIVVHKLGGGGILQPEIESQRRVVKERLEGCVRWASH